MQKQTLANHDINMIDLGEQGDSYIRSFNNDRDATLISELLTRSEVTYRGITSTIGNILNTSYPYFLPFGAHINTLPNVRIISVGSQVFTNAFESGVAVSMSMIADGALTYKTISDYAITSGCTFRSLISFPIPETSFEKDTSVGSTIIGGRAFQVSNIEGSQHKRATLVWPSLNQDQTKSLLVELTQNIRSLEFAYNKGSIYFPYTFGVDEGKGAKTIKLDSQDIEITHVGAMNFSVKIRVALCR